MDAGRCQVRTTPHALDADGGPMRGRAVEPGTWRIYILVSLRVCVCVCMFVYAYWVLMCMHVSTRARRDA
jgi:hypothetical protein